MTTFTLHAIDPAELASARRSGHDVAGRPVEPFAGAGGEQLRCCLSRARPGDRLLLLGHTPLGSHRPWAETGPVFVHADACAGFTDGRVPAWFDAGDRVLRAYTADGAMPYRANQVVAAGDGVAEALARTFAGHDPDDVAEVHVRNLLAQCFVARAVRG